MAYRKSHRLRLGRLVALRAGGLKNGRRATRKVFGLKRGGLSRRVKRGGEGELQAAPYGFSWVRLMAFN